MTEDIRSLTQIRGRLALKREGELRAALAQMTAERDGLQGELARRKTELHLQGKQLDIEFRGRVAAEAKLEAVKAVLVTARQTWIANNCNVLNADAVIRRLKEAMKGE